MKKKIAVFGVKGFPAFGGASRANENIVNELKSEYDFTIYSVSSHTDKSGYYNGFYQKVFTACGGKRLNPLIYQIKSLLHSLFCANYDLIQVNHLSSGFIVPFLRLKYKVVSTARGIVPPDDNKWNKADKLLFDISSFFFFRFSNVSISVSESHIKKFRKFTNKEIIYIPNGVSIIDYPKDIIEDNTIVFSAGRIISLKGAHILTEALNMIKYSGKIIYIGSMEHTPDYCKNLVMLGAKLNIEYTGLIKDKNVLFSIINKAKLFVFPSFNEGMSNMLLEVASLKTPLICSDIEENRSVFNSDEVLFFETGDSKDLASKIIWALNNYDIMIKKAEAAYKKLIEKYQWSNIAKQYKEIYDSILFRNET